MKVDGLQFHIFTAIIFFAVGVWYANRSKNNGKLKGLG